MKKLTNFAVFILTHARADRVLTYKTLLKNGYTGQIYLIVDDLDPELERYINLYPGKLIIFNKELEAKVTDVAYNSKDLKGVVFARNASFKIAEQLGLDSFAVFDDDYNGFKYRFDQHLDYSPKVMKNLDQVFNALSTYLLSSGIDCIALAQGGDFIGGECSDKARLLKSSRKIMNSFFLTPKRAFKFCGKVNEDASAYVRLGNTGKVFLTTYQGTIEQTQTQINPGGLTEIYLDDGTYVKSFYTVMYQPSSVKIRPLKDRAQARLHHSVKWRYTVPKILREGYTSIRGRRKDEQSTTQDA